ncbi:sensor histidine kinase [Anoxynatronum buryatiense]|uniref:histidine kinase n=1 Tax=Anoxynatronum buryatiense TaxID=489973 RepID=A0AA45WSR9_9CLOT|nr:cache domain-containing protein [Anoxynatronum buryatiense]SMP38058.1 HAMP domain-containing protein [Anoxynatronum buryatiense]
MSSYLRLNSFSKQLLVVTLTISFFSLLLISGASIYRSIDLNERALIELEKSLYQEVDKQTKAQVTTVITMLEEINRKIISGELTSPEGQQLAADLIREMRYADASNQYDGYFWVDTTEGVNVVLYGSPSEGRYRLDFQDQSGRFIVRDMIETAIHGNGYEEYYFPRLGGEEPLPKRSYAGYFEPFNWVIGTGAYVDDIEYLIAEKRDLFQKELMNDVMHSVLFLTAILILVTFVSLKATRRITRPVMHISRELGKVASGDYANVNIPSHFLERHDEIGKLSDSVMQMTRQREQEEYELKRLNLELSGKNDELEQIIYVASHDLRSPLVNVQGFSQELGFAFSELREHLSSPANSDEGQHASPQLETLLHEEIPECLTFINSSTQKMDLLLKGLLKYSRTGRQGIQMAEVDMAELIQEQLSSQEYIISQHQIKVTTGELPNVYGDRMLVGQLFFNLIDNAIKYRHSDRSSYVHIAGHRSEHAVEYLIEDNGIGFSSHYYQKVFDIFHRLHPNHAEGEGLGLSIVKKILSIHQGQIHVSSTPGEGSQFRIILPLPKNPNIDSV